MAPRTEMFREAAYEAARDAMKTRMFLLGLSSGTAGMLFLVCIAVMVASYDPNAGAIHTITGWPYPLFRSAFLLCLCQLCYGVVIFCWRRAKVDYRGALGCGAAVTYSAVLSYAYACFTLVFASFVVYALVLLAPEAVPGARHFRDALPVMAFLSPLLVLVWPGDRAPLGCGRTRGASAARAALVFEFLGPVLASPFSEVTFARTLVAAVLTSLPKIFADAQYALCVIGDRVAFGGPMGVGSPGRCGSGSFYRRVLFLLQVGPFFIRVAQSGRQFRDDPRSRASNAANGAKYGLAVLLVAFSVLKEARPDERVYARGWLLLAVFTTLLNQVWEVLVDWGLWTPRPRLFPDAVYYYVVVSNFFARLGWAVLVSPDQTIVKQHVILLLGCIEVVRRFQWVLIRVEHEHVKLHGGETARITGAL